MAATGKNAVRGFDVRDAGRAVARRERPRCRRLPGLDVNHLNRVLAFNVDENVPLAIGSRALWGRVLEFDSGRDVAGPGIERGESADRAAVVGKDDLVVRFVE